MGKYMRKAKTAVEEAVMDVTQSPLGVRTRAKTLALERLQKSSPSAPGGDSFLQLRSRRLVKPSIILNESSRGPKKAREHANSNASSRNSVRDAQADSGLSVRKTEIGKEEIEVQDHNSKDELDVEASFGENVLDSEPRERSTRESTPCSLIRNPDAIRTPGSTTRPTSSMETRGVQNSTPRSMPTAAEIEEFFAAAEKEQQKKFIERYNFDIVNDKPLPGHFEWEKVCP